MPLQNRVDPYGILHAVEARGAWMGNRGILHDDEKRLVVPWRLKRWITCVLIFKGRKRQVFTPHRYSELFFLDEATSFAAGHRPCAECQRERYNEFRAAWIDFRATLHQQDVNQAQFAMSPGCVATSTNVDAKLPPCTLMAATIVGKTTNTRPSESYGHVTDYNLSVRETTTGTTHEYRQVSDSFWGEVSVGQQVSIKQWRGQQVELDAGTENIDLTTFIGDARGTFERAVAWFIAATGSMAALQLLWWRPRRRRPIQLF